ncbi:WD40/YVTN/BNR-like repeat-containing protein [Variovorax paradoxus]|nr:YCF48-related protein [Variovorax paradoxus]
MAASPPGRILAALREPALKTARMTSVALLASAKAGERLVCVGERGIAIYSDDSGQSWMQAHVPVSATLTAVNFVSPSLGWCVGHLGVVLNTQDGGRTWTKQLDGLQLPAVINALADDPASSLGLDAKARLKSQAVALESDGPDKPFFDLDFRDERQGVVVGAYNLAFRTGDGGRTWKPFSHDIDNPKGMHLYALARRGSDLFAVGEQGIVLRASGEGTAMKAAISPYKGTLFGAVSTEGSLVAYGLRGKAFASIDGATTWHESITGVGSSIGCGVALGEERIALATHAGDLLLSENGGRIFKRQSMPEALAFTSLLFVKPGLLIGTTLRGVRRVSLA